jgi:predicted transcriptional regulator
VTSKKHSEKPSVELTEAEWVIMRAIWEHQPCAAGTVQEALAASKGWAYSTVKTTMDRMVRKGLLRTQRIRNLLLFSATVDEVEANAANSAGCQAGLTGPGPHDAVLGGAWKAFGGGSPSAPGVDPPADPGGETRPCG